MRPYQHHRATLVVISALTAVTVLTGGLLGPATTAQALTPGWLDTDYGLQGLAVALGASDQYGGGGTVDSSGRAVVLSPVSAVVDQIQITRFAVNGAKDSTFGTGGATTLPDGSRYTAISAAGDAIYVAGPAASGNGIALVRLSASGVLDTTYGTGGQVVVAIPDTITAVTGIARLANGDVVLAGRHSATSTTSYVAAVDATGGLDAAWNAGGSTPGVVPSSNLVADLDTDGNHALLLLVAATGTSQVQRRAANGTLDTGFGSGGARALPTTFGAGHLGVESDGDYYVTGADGPSRQGTMAVTRLLPSGTVDATFGTAGTARIPLSDCEPTATSVAVRSPYVYVFGTHRSFGGPSCPTRGPIIARLSAAGVVDPAFGSGGAIQMSEEVVRGSMVPAEVFDGAVQPDGHPVLALALTATDNIRMGAIRLHADSVAPSGAFVPLVPRRLLDTRSGTGGPLPGGGLLSLPIAGHAGVPSTGAGAVVLNVTAVAPTRRGYVTVYPGGQNRPPTSNLNYAAGATTPVAVTVALNGSGAVNLYNGSSGSVHLLVDVVGYYRSGAATAPGSFTALTPARIVDTRDGTGTPAARIAGGATLTFGVSGAGGVPGSNVSAAVLSVTAVTPGGSGYLTAYAGGASRPVASSLSYASGQTRANEVTVGLGAAGDVSVYNGSSGSVDLLVDVAGYYLGGTPTDPGTFVAVTPRRLLDTRTTGPFNPGPIRPHASWPSPFGAPVASALVLNGTVTQETRAGFMAYQGENTYLLEHHPVSTLNFVAHQTVANMTITSGSDFTIYNGSSGTAQAIADLAGYFMP
ncbi:MAG: hypothetical protein ACJ71T_03485 [Actinomycetales bacterium]